ncbi:P-loop containing nucleoside triphosphate hydrolase protein [Lenzites betulinus]|nr:P-loop containing nucleoside triphosphate hydrolase protein [Lenzites betulinus]
MPSLPRWSTERIRGLVEKRFGKRPCLFQIRVARAIRERQNDVVAVAATGSGKTLSFWIPLLMAIEDGEDKIAIVVTPLNLLGKQNTDILAEAGVTGRYQVLVLGPEIIMQEDGLCAKLWEKPAFAAKILYIVFDEAHCITQWAGFREEYKSLGDLRRIISGTIPFYMPSATMPVVVLREVKDAMHLRKGHTEYILRSNDRPEIGITVHRMQHAASSFKDLDFLIPEAFREGDVPPPKFLVFFESTKESEAAAAYLRSRLPAALSKKIRYFHSIMTPQYREEECDLFKDNETYGLCVTDSFGMVSIMLILHVYI